MKTKSTDYVERFCSGCGICKSLIGSDIILDDRGFPNVVADVDNMGFYKKVCPVFHYSKECGHDVWGEVSNAFIGYSTNENTRYRAASGGALTELSIFLIESKKVDGIIHTTYNPLNQTETITCVSRTADEIRSRCGSRYSISSPLSQILDILCDKEKYAFVGKPCDVMSLRKAMEINTTLRERIPYLLSFFCAGEPSVRAQINLLNAMGTDIDSIDSITYRGNGWPGFTTVVEKNGNIKKLEYKKAWGQYLGRDLRTICRFCLDGTGDAADIVCADFWYLDENDKPDFSEHDGRSIIISRTDKGDDILNGAIEYNLIHVENDFTQKMSSEFHLYQPAQLTRKGTMESMIRLLRVFGRQTPKYSKSILKRYASHISTKTKLKYYYGTLKRIVKGRL